MAKTKTLLIITQRVDINDDTLGFFHRWLEKFSEKLDKIYVICLWEGEHNLPPNVVVKSMGKERGTPKIFQFLLFQEYLMQALPNVDGVFLHMCPIYAIASFPLIKIFRKKMILWFLHKELKWKLKLAERLVDKVLTASEESCRLKNRKKIEILGHGVDIGLFKPRYNTNEKLKIICVGRISPIKDQETLIEAVDILVNQKNIVDLEVKIIGSSLDDSEKRYYEKVKNLVQKKKLGNYIKFLGGMPQKETVRFYQESDVLVNLCPTGGVDKAVLEAMACAVPVIVCNETFRKDLGPYADKLVFQEKNPMDLAQKIYDIRKLNKTEIGSYLRQGAVRNYDLDNLIDKIINQFK